MTEKDKSPDPQNEHEKFELEETEEISSRKKQCLKRITLILISLAFFVYALYQELRTLILLESLLLAFALFCGITAFYVFQKRLKKRFEP